MQAARITLERADACASRARLPKYVHAYRDRAGREYCYFRYRGTRTRLPPLGDADFEEAYAAAKAVNLALPSLDAEAQWRRQFDACAAQAIFRAMGRSERRGHERPQIDKKWMLDRIAEQKCRCAITGIRFTASIPDGERWKANPFAPSLDRIDGSKGYEPGNVRVVLAAVNLAMNEWGLEVLMQIAAALVKRAAPVDRRIG